MDERAIFDEIPSLAQGQRRQRDEIQRPIGNHKHAGRVSEMRGNGIPDLAAKANAHRRERRSRRLDAGIGGEFGGHRTPPASHRGIDRSGRAEGHDDGVGAIGPEHETKIRRHDSRPSGSRGVRDRSEHLAVVPHEGHERAVRRQTLSDLVQTDRRARHLRTERGALLPQRSFGVFLFLLRLADEGRVLFRALRSRTADHQVGKTLARLPKGDPQRRSGTAGLVVDGAAPHRHLVEHERPAAHDRIED